MIKLSRMHLAAIVLLISIALVNCIPTSVLVKDSKLSNNFKVKRSSSNGKPSSSASSLTSKNKKSDVELLPASSSNFKSESSSNQEKSTLHKRGANSQLLYGDMYNTAPVSQLSNGVWGDEIDPAVMYSDLQDFDDYPRGQYRNKAYDNLQNLLNSEQYNEPMSYPLQYPHRFYGDRKKRSNRYDKSSKRDTKLTPADMLALVALVEAGERSRQEAENENLNNDYMKSYYPSYGLQTDEENSWNDPAMIDYYGMPYNLETIPKYEIAREQKYGSNRYPSKRYMISKKKRSLGYYHGDTPTYMWSDNFAPKRNPKFY